MSLGLELVDVEGVVVKGEGSQSKDSEGRWLSLHVGPDCWPFRGSIWKSMFSNWIYLSAAAIVGEQR